MNKQEKSDIAQTARAHTSHGKRLGEILIDLGYITQPQLDEALEYQKEKGGRLGWILACLGYVNRLELYGGLADHFGLPFETNTAYMKRNIDTELIAKVTHEELMRYQAIPFTRKDNVLSILTAEPKEEATLLFFQDRFGVDTIKEIVITDLDLTRLSEQLYRGCIQDESVHGLFYRNPDESAYKVLSRLQRLGLLLALCISLFWIYNSATSFFLIFFVFIQVYFAVAILFRLIVSIWGFGSKWKQQVTEEELKDLDPKTLPVYTILLPVYKETEIIETLITAINKLDYPEDKLDVMLLVEEGDEETLAAAKRARPPASWRFITIPDCLPKTKPKAMNYGLHFARGKYLTIYDAEDIPDPDQLKKAVISFRKQSDDYVCFQAALNYYNRYENFLTRMFTLEYSYWFDCFIPGLYKLGMPLPLGGTSNHFDVRKLKQLGGWDPFNVTEDADLGMRASAKGYKVGVIDSTTYEEANSKLSNWIRQRSRWVKGYMQTFLVHNRHPIQALRNMGMKQWFGYNLLIGGTVVSFLVSPLLWVLFFYWLLLRGDVFDAYFYLPFLMEFATFNLIFGNIAVIVLSLLSALPRKYYQLLLWALLSPIYWLLQSVGAYKALWQLITKPSYWEKTEHGISHLLFSIDVGFEDDLNKGFISEKLKDIFKTEGVTLSGNAKLTKERGDKWGITDREKKYSVKKEEGMLINIYK